jgi:hypothetical protein
MKSSGKRSASRKVAKEPRGRKGLEESERQLTGAGWTAAATQHFIDLPNDDERLAHVRAMFTISEEDYKYQIRQTFIADFHLANGLYCLDQAYDALQAQFICRSMAELLGMTLAAAQQPEKMQYDRFRVELLERYQTLFFEFNAEDFRFTLEQAEQILKFVSHTIISPLRLIVITFRHDPEEVILPEARKLLQPPVPPPLSGFSVLIPLPPPEAQFTPPDFPRLSGLTLADVREAMARYTARSLQVIERRYNRMDELAQRIGQW